MHVSKNRTRNSKNRTVFIYSLADPADPCLVRYVGKAKDTKKRLYGHMRNTTRTPLGNWIHSLNERKIKPILTVLATVGTEYADAEEMTWIRRCYSPSLLNLDGLPHRAEWLVSYNNELRWRVNRWLVQRGFAVVN